ncbi:HlyD family type I secretion periplasmic adaptor subunit [Rubrivivax albus]|uniref:Membrane fusion protein (MFP) family protein n=1 Tax=Rubrivivax albus TaxID=2499835 RepID=A0A3S2U115_9BURK|nr:HlyD family type I secretion periplasmic adaptor subunit [Rubrivivax albus]RVT49488.1 HlyD family type I secretion periplasmic adaptor subunit [Rubrivivax albus]
MSVTQFPAAAASPGPEAAPYLAVLLARWRRAGLLALAGWAAVALLWFVAAPISGAIVGGGSVKVEANRQTVSHRDGGIVAQVLVREGQAVARGQTLIMLEDERVASSVDLLQAQLLTERLRVDRLTAERSLASAWAGTLPPGADDVRGREALARERANFLARRQSLDRQLQAAAAQIADIDTEIAAHRRNDAASTQALALLREEIASNEALARENFVNRSRVMTLQRGVADYEARIEGARAESAQARQRRAELAGRMESLRAAYVQQASEELAEAGARVVDLEERLRAGSDTAGRQVVTAPVAGRLVSLRVNTVGSAVGPREPLVDIVPVDVPLVVEARVGPDAVSELRPGLKAEVRLLGARQREVPLLDGTLVQVSADALHDPQGGPPYFLIQVEVPATEVQSAGVTLHPGMATEVFVTTSDRTALDFLLDPLLSGLRRSFREH